MSDAKHILFEHVFRTAEAESIQRRACLYRALAEYAGDPDQAASLHRLATALEEVDQRCFEFTQGFSAQTRFNL